MRKVEIKNCPKCGHIISRYWREIGNCTCETASTCFHGTCQLTKFTEGRPMLENSSGYIALFDLDQIGPAG